MAPCFIEVCIRMFFFFITFFGYKIFCSTWINTAYSKWRLQKSPKKCGKTVIRGVAYWWHLWENSQESHSVWSLMWTLKPNGPKHLGICCNNIPLMNRIFISVPGQDCISWSFSVSCGMEDVGRKKAELLLFPSSLACPSLGFQLKSVWHFARHPSHPKTLRPLP